MSSKYVKIASLQGVSSIADNQLIDFIIPPNSYYNLANSYLSIMARLDTTENETYDPTNKVGIHAVSIVGVDNIPYRNNVLIKDYRLTSDRVIDIENLQDSNVINVNMDAFGRDFEQIKSDNYTSLCGQFNNPTYSSVEPRVGNFRTLNKSILSTEDVMEVKIPLSSFSSFCNTTLYDTNRFGRSQMKVQIDRSKFVVDEYNPYPFYDEFHRAINAEADATSIVSTGFANFISSWNIVAGNKLQIIATRDAVVSIDTKVVEEVSYSAANNGTFTIKLADASIFPAASTNISYWRVFEQFSCEDINNTGQSNAITKLTSDTEFTEQEINDYKMMIGSSIVISATGCAAIAPYVDRTLTNVEAVDMLQHRSKVKFTFTPAFIQNNGEDIANIVLSLTDPDKLVLDDIPAAGPAGATITKYTVSNKQLENLNLWVGCKVFLRGTFPAGPNVNGYYTTIKSLTQNGANVDIVVNDSIQLANTQTITGLRLQVVSVEQPVNLDTITGLPVIVKGSFNLELYNPTMVLHELYGSHRQVKQYVGMPNKQLQYSYWKPEAINIPASTKNFVRLFQVDGSCRNAFAIIKKGDNLLSVADNLLSYRWRINNYDKTLRDIYVDTSLEQDNIVATLNNSDIVSLRSVQSLQKEYGNLGDFIVIPMTSVPMDGQMKTLMLTLNYTTPTVEDKILYLVKECSAVLAL